MGASRRSASTVTSSPGGDAALDELDEARAGRARQLDGAVRRSGGGVHRVHVGAGGDRADGADDAGAARRGGRDEGTGPRFDDVEHRHRQGVPEIVEAGGGGRVAGDDDDLDVVVLDEAPRQLPGEPAHVLGRLGSVGIAPGVADVHEVLAGQEVDDGSRDGQPSEAGVEHPDRTIHGPAG
jgi:hypothetical protein